MAVAQAPVTPARGHEATQNSSTSSAAMVEALS